MRWQHPLFVHLEVARGPVERRLPPDVTLDPQVNAPGKAVVSLVALGAEGPGPAFVVDTMLRRLVRYTQLNLRAYVRGAHGAGLAFLEARTDHLWPLSARAAGWPYRRDGKLAFEADDQAVALRADGVSLRGLPAVGMAQPVGVDDPARRWLERYVSYGALPGGLPYAVRISHGPWLVRPVALDPDYSIELRELGEARLGDGAGARVLSVQLAESMEVHVEDVLPAGEPRHGLMALFERAALTLVRGTP